MHSTNDIPLELNKVYIEDCICTMNRMPSDFLDLTITSPPYDNMRYYDGNFKIDIERIITSLYRVTKSGGVVVWVVGDQTTNWDESGSSFKQALYFKQIGFGLFDTMIYLKKPRGACGNNQGYWQTFEYMFVFSKGKPKTINLICDRENKEERKGDSGTKRLHSGQLYKHPRGGYQKYGRRTNVWEYNVGKGHSTKDNFAFSHPAIFPEKLVEDHLFSWSNEGDLVYDPFVGSGTTAKMCLKLKRNFISSEINPEYAAIANKRVSNLYNLFGDDNF
jgi:DNA modification methylase